MCKSIEEALFYQPIPKVKIVNSKDSASPDVSAEDKSLNDSSILPEPAENTTETAFKGVSLKDFEVHRRLIEEQNKQKKDLHKAIEAHSQKTAAEAKKIEEIKIELSKLDNELATDMALLRKRIDTPCCSIFSVESKANKTKNLESVDFLFVSKNVNDSRRYQLLCWNLGVFTDTSNPLRRNKKIMTLLTAKTVLCWELIQGLVKHSLVIRKSLADATSYL